ncbi:hypothetical protein GMDG_07105 [Pseudogymnoascus destructans 20631-21]|uniref:Mediator of RNA polymerase II transcription subunit 22 n=2 Tax=Pseudogymnoascus destructans TaxID=655981 RepID=L8FV86_PSED2|nr:hypothetical protein GMDG_07105 [Pseudogymnoascus destructans 20631-21]
MSNDRRSPSRSASADQTANEASQAVIANDGDVTHVAPLSPPAPLPSSLNTRTGPSTNELMEREQGIVDAMLLRFKNIIELATTNKGDVTSEVAAAQAFQTNVETQALIRAAQDLLSLTREMKELWLFGPLRGLGEGEEGGSIDDNSKRVVEMVEAMIQERTGREM